MRLIPTPPAFDDNRKMSGKGEAYSAPKAGQKFEKRTARGLRRLVKFVNVFLALVTRRGSGREADPWNSDERIEYQE